MKEIALVVAVMLTIWGAIHFVPPPAVVTRGPTLKIRSNRTPYRFGLRTLLLAITVVAAALGLLVFMLR
jgi:hypothetical protein